MADVSALAQFLPITTWLLNVTGTISEQAKLGRRLRYSQEEELSNHTLPEATVCLPSPFVFLLTNITNGSEVDCKNASVECFLSECWNGTWKLVIVLKVPTFAPLPVEADPEQFPIAMLLCERRDFGITAAIVTAIVVSSAAAITAGVAMATQIQTAASFNEIATKTADVLDTQTKISKHMLSGIVAANQRIDFLQTQIDELASLVQVGCIAHQKHVCITSLVFNNSRNESERIG